MDFNRQGVRLDNAHKLKYTDMRNFKVYYRVYVAGRWQKATKIVQGQSVDDAVKNADLWVNLISRVEMIELVTNK